MHMIESSHWKEVLASYANALAPAAKPPRWTERRHDFLLLNISQGFFILRRLIELHKVSSTTRNHAIEVGSLRTVKRVTYQNLHRLDELYDWSSDTPSKKKPLYIANQFIHAYSAVAARDRNRNWSDVFVVSDYDHKNVIWRVPVSEIRNVFSIAANDYPHSGRTIWNEKKQDYDVETN